MHAALQTGQPSNLLRTRANNNSNPDPSPFSLSI